MCSLRPPSWMNTERLVSRYHCDAIQMNDCDLPVCEIQKKPSQQCHTHFVEQSSLFMVLPAKVEKSILTVKLPISESNGGFITAVTAKGQTLQTFSPIHYAGFLYFETSPITAAIFVNMTSESTKLGTSSWGCSTSWQPQGQLPRR